MKLFQPFAFDSDAVSAASSFVQSDDEVSLTLQSQRDDSDINVIIARALKSGVMPDSALKEPQYADMTVFQAKSYVDHLHASIVASRQYSALPDDIRAKYPDADAWLASLGQPNAVQPHVDGSAVVTDKPLDGAVSSSEPKA